MDVATMLRNQAVAKQEKRNSRMSGTTLLAHIAALLNSDDKFSQHLEDLWRGKTKHGAMVNRYTTVIRDNGLDELVSALDYGEYGVCLVKLVDDSADADDSDDEN